MRADRLLSILMLLQTKGRMTAHDLASQLEVSERTIYRDLDALSTAGIPIYTERGPNGGCSLIDGYQTRLTGLTEAEVRALFLFNMAAPLADLGLGKVLDDALLKLEAALPAASRAKVEQVQQRFHLDATWWYHPADASTCLQTIQEALWQDHKLYLVYCENDGTWHEYTLDPYGLVSKAGLWYLIGVSDECYQVLRVSHIMHTLLLDEQFQRSANFDLARYWAEYCAQLEMNRPPYAVPLRLAPDDVARLPQLLSEWGYMLVESEEALEPDEQVFPLHNYAQHYQKNAYVSTSNGAQWHRPQQKNGRGTSHEAGSHHAQTKKTHGQSVPQQKKRIRRPASRYKKNSIFVLKKTGDWLPLDSPFVLNKTGNQEAKEKKVATFHGPETPPLQQQEKKRIQPARNGSGGQPKEKKAPSQKKKNASVLQRKKTAAAVALSTRKKTHAPLIKKSYFPRPSKKTLYYFSLSENLQSA